MPIATGLCDDSDCLRKIGRGKVVAQPTMSCEQTGLGETIEYDGNLALYLWSQVR